VASPGTVVSAEVEVDVSVQSVTVDVTVLSTPQAQEVSLPVYALNDLDLYTPSDPRTPLEVAEGLTPVVPLDSVKDIFINLEPSEDEVLISLTPEAKEVFLPVYAPDASGVYGDFDPRTTLEVDEGLTPLVPLDSLKEATIPTYYGDNQEFIIPVLPIYVESFRFSVNTENLAYSSYDYRDTAGTLRSTQTQGKSGGALNNGSLGYTFEIGTVVPISPMFSIGAPTATPSSGATVTSVTGGSVTSPSATVISSANNQYTLPTISGGVYNFQVEWGDGQSDLISSWDDPKVLHTYSTSGIYTISITGTFEGMCFSRHGDEGLGGTGNVDCLKLLNVESWGVAAYMDVDLKVYPYHPLSSEGIVVFDSGRPQDIESTSYTTGAIHNASSAFDGCANWNDVSGQKPNFKYVAGAKHGNNNTSASGGKYWGSSNNLRMWRWNNNMAFDMGVWGPEDEPFIGGSQYGHFYQRAVPEGSSDMKLNYYWTDAEPSYLAYSPGTFRLADNSGNYVNTTMSFDVTNWTMKGQNPNYSLQSSFGGLRGFDGDVSGLVVPGVRQMFGTFASCTSFTGKGVETWDTSTCPTMASLFQGCKSFNKDVSHFTFGVPCSVAAMLFGADSFNQSLSDWDVKNVTNTTRLVKGSDVYNNGGQAWTDAHWKINEEFKEMFMSSPFNQDVSKWILPTSSDLPQGFSMESTFYATPFNRPVDTHTGDDGTVYWDMSSCTNISGMFAAAYDFNQPVNSWNTGNVTNMSAVFNGGNGTHSFNQPLSNWDTSKVTTMLNMLRACRSFNHPLVTDGKKWDVSKVRTMEAMFYLCQAFDQDLSSWDVSSVEDFSSMFRDADAFNQDLSSWNTGAAILMAYMFSFTTSFNGDISTWDVSKVTNMIGMFRSSSAFNQDLSSWDTSSLANMKEMFYKAASFDGDVSNWDVSNVTTMNNSFLQAPSFTGKGLSTWRPSSALTSMIQTFYETALAADTDLGAWDVSGVTTLNRCFYNTDLFTGVNLDQWDVSSVEDMTLVFNLSNKVNPDVSGWDVSSVKNLKGMFKGATDFNRNLANWNLSSLDSNVDIYNLSGGGSFDSGSVYTLPDGTEGIYSGIGQIFNGSAMSKANLDLTISGWCDSANTPNGSTLPWGKLQLGTIPLNNSEASQRLDPATITKMEGKNMSAKYTDGNFVY